MSRFPYISVGHIYLLIMAKLVLLTMAWVQRSFSSGQVESFLFYCSTSGLRTMVVTVGSCTWPGNQRTNMLFLMIDTDNACAMDIHVSCFYWNKVGFYMRLSFAFSVSPYWYPQFVFQKGKLGKHVILFLFPHQCLDDMVRQLWQPQTPQGRFLGWEHWHGAASRSDH